MTPVLGTALFLSFLSLLFTIKMLLKSYGIHKQIRDAGNMAPIFGVYKFTHIWGIDIMFGWWYLLIRKGPTIRKFWELKHGRRMRKLAKLERTNGKRNVR